MSSLLSSNIGGNIDEGLCSASFCETTFKNTIDIPTSMAKARNDANTFKFKIEIVLSLVYRIIKYLFKFQEFLYLHLFLN